MLYLCLVTQSCPTLCNSMDSPVHRILQAKILKWVAMSSSRSFDPKPGIKPRPPTLKEDSLLSEPPVVAITQTAYK